MDSQERHELQQNDLEHFLSNFGEFWNRWGNTILTFVLVVIVAVTVWRFWTSSQATAFEEAWYDLAIAADQPAVAYEQVAESHSDPAVRTLAYLRGGDAALAEAIGVRSVTTPEDPAAEPQANPDEKLAMARQMYDAAIEHSPALVYRLNAVLRLGAVAEAQRDWDAARQAYEQVLELAGPGYDLLANRARVRLDLLEEIAAPIIFASEAEPAQATPDTPASESVIDLPEFDFSPEPADPATDPAPNAE